MHPEYQSSALRLQASHVKAASYDRTGVAFIYHRAGSANKDGIGVGRQLGLAQALWEVFENRLWKLAPVERRHNRVQRDARTGHIEASIARFAVVAVHYRRC
jgi:hypothetical protein